MSYSSKTMAIWLLVSLEPALATSEDIGDFQPKLEEMSVAELTTIQVSSVSRKSQNLADTAAAAFVISHEDIQRSGARNIPDALRLAPGVEVAQISASRWAITIRGFNGEYSDKLLVLMDGRTLYTPLFAGVFWDQQDTMMEDIERIEVIRGPGAVMWGSNAVNGVVNIITKKAKYTQGNLFVAGGGNQESGFVSFRHGGQINENGNYRVYAKAFERDAYLNANSSRAYDDWRSAQAGFRYDHWFSSSNRFIAHGDVYRMNKGCQSQPYTFKSPFNTKFVEDCYGDGANIVSRWETVFNNGSELVLQGYYDRVGFQSVATANIQDTFDLDIQHRLHQFAEHDLMWGLNYRFIHSASDNTPVFKYHPSNLAYHQGSAFLQDDIALIKDNLRLTLGSKIEESHFGHTQVQPNARLLWTPSSNQSVWTSISRAARIPSQGDATADIDVATTYGKVGPFTVPVQLMILANPNLKSEKVFTAEIGYRAQWSSNISSDITLFDSEYSDQIVLRRSNLITSSRPLIQQLLWKNMDKDITTRGIELTGDWQALQWLRLSPSYSHLIINNKQISGTSPKNRVSLRLQADLTDQVQADATVRYVSQLQGLGIEAYSAIDARLSYRPIKSMEWSVAVLNMFAPQHFEYNDSPINSSNLYSIAVPRSIYGKLSWSF